MIPSTCHGSELIELQNLEKLHDLSLSHPNDNINTTVKKATTMAGTANNCTVIVHDELPKYQQFNNLAVDNHLKYWQQKLNTKKITKVDHYNACIDEANNQIMNEEDIEISNLSIHHQDCQKDKIFNSSIDEKDKDQMGKETDGIVDRITKAKDDGQLSKELSKELNAKINDGIKCNDDNDTTNYVEGTNITKGKDDYQSSTPVCAIVNAGTEYNDDNNQMNHPSDTILNHKYVQLNNLSQDLENDHIYEPIMTKQTEDPQYDYVSPPNLADRRLSDGENSNSIQELHQI